MSIYDHFRSEERPFIDQVIEWRELVKGRFVHKLSDFLDPRQQQIVSTIIGNDPELSYEFFGGDQKAERKRVLLYPSYFQLSTEDLQICLYRLMYPQKFVQLEHRDILGSLMSIGLKREKFGDIYIQEGNIQIIVAKEISNYLEANFLTVGKTNIKLEQLPLDQVVAPKEEWSLTTITVSSLRLDAVLAEIYKISRAKVIPYIENKRVKVNWKVVEQSSYPLQKGDFLSVRGLGRSKVVEINGKTKKEKWRMTVGILK